MVRHFFPVVFILLTIPVSNSFGQAFYNRGEFISAVPGNFGTFNFEEIDPDTDITAQTFQREHAITFDRLNIGCGNSTYRCGTLNSASLVVIESSVGLPSTSGGHLLSPGGPDISGCDNPPLENDDLLLIFDPPVQAFGLDIIFKSADGNSYLGIRFVDESGTILFENPFVPSPNNGTGNPGPQFVGFNSGDAESISRVEIDEYDENCGQPDEHVGYDSMLYSIGDCPDGAIYEGCRIVESAGILFGERYSRDATQFGPAGEPVFFDSTLVTVTKNPGDRFYLSGQSATLDSLICDDEVFIVLDDTVIGVGLGPYEIYNPDFEPCLPIGEFLRPVGALEITPLVPDGTNCIEFRLGDTQREIYGNTEIYLIRMTMAGVEVNWANFFFMNYPNPFNPQTTIAFELPKRETVSLRVFDMAGRLVKNLISAEPHTHGRHEVVWNGRDDYGRQVASGTYFYRLEAGSFSETKRMVLVK